MTWQYVPSDDYDMDDLIDARNFYLTDLVAAQDDFNKYAAYAKYGLPGLRVDQIRRQIAIEEAETNLQTVNRAIEERSK